MMSSGNKNSITAGERIPRWLLIVIFMCVITCVVCLQSYSNETVAGKSEIRVHDRIFYDVFLKEKNEERNITNFKAWEFIDESSLSPDGTLLLVRHKPNKGRRLILSVYDAQSGNIIGRRQAEFGGILGWCGNSKIVHIWGCGTNCYNVRVYSSQLSIIPLPDLKVKDIYGGFVLSSSNNYLLMYSMRGFGYCLVDLQSMAVIDHCQPEEMSEDSEFIASAVFSGEGEITFKMVNRVSGESSIRTIEFNPVMKKQIIK